MKPFTEEDRYVYDLTPESWVIDAGAHKGDFTAGIVDRYDCHVISLEPILRFYLGTADRFRENPKVRVMNCGLGSTTKECRMFIRGDSSGLFGTGEHSELVTVYNAPDFFKEIGISRFDLIKLNIEGAEFEVLEHWLARKEQVKIRNIQVQFHPVVSEFNGRYLDIRHELLKTHHLTFDAPWCWENYRLNE